MKKFNWLPRCVKVFVCVDVNYFEVNIFLVLFFKIVNLPIVVVIVVGVVVSNTEGGIP